MRSSRPLGGAAYVLLWALSDKKTAMLYSLGAMTSYGHTNVYLNPHWRLLGALEALQGMLLFGLTTAFLFSIFHQVSPLKNSQVATSVTERAS
jgi:O-antigen/teichoic acid export membrane protein